MLRSRHKHLFTSGYVQDVQGGNFKTLPSHLVGSVLPVTANLVAWYDSSYTTGITDAGGGKVSQWNDRSGNGWNATQSTDANRPFTGTRTINGINVLDFDGSRWLASSCPMQPRPISSFHVSLWDGPSGSHYMSLGSNGGLGTWFSGFQLYTVKDDTIGLFVNPALKVTPGSPYARVDVLNASTVDQYFNGDSTLGNSNSTALTAGATLEIGRSPLEPSFRWDGAIAEVAIYSSALSSADATSLVAYARSKWGTP